MAPAARTLQIGLVVVPDCGPAALYGLHEVFSFAGQDEAGLFGGRAGPVRLAPRLVAERPGVVTCQLGAPVRPHATFDSAGACDVVVVSDLALGADPDPRKRWPAAAAWIRRQYGQGAIVGSVCTGSLLLAEAGLLDGQEATTHWGAVPLFRRHYPQVRLAPARIIAPAGPDQRIVTSGGHAAWSELALYLIARLCGREAAVRTAKVFLLGDRSDGQLPFAAMVRPRTHEDAAIANSQLWIAEHYAWPHPVARMTAVSGLAPRTFKRRFAAATGYTPLTYAQTLRIEEARQLLEASALPTDEVGEQVGYGDAASFRRLFKRLTGVTPARYRQRIQGLVPAGKP